MFESLKKLFFFFFMMLSGISLYADKKISSEDARILSPLFKLLLENTEAGYVLYSKKPVCTVAYSQFPFFFGDFKDSDPFDQLAVATYAAQTTLKQPLFCSGNIVFHFDEKDQLLLIINRKFFLKTVQENLPLFQYVLGPSVTPDSLLTALLSPEHAFCEVLNYDRVLIGIVLGYGTQNSLFNSRLENIENDGILACDIPPFTPKAMLSSDADNQRRLLFLNKSENSKWKKKCATLRPSLGFSSLKEESEEISKRIAISSKQLLSETPNFVFSCLKEESDFIKDLESTQKKIKKLIHSHKYLQRTLEIIFQEEVEIEQVGQATALPNVDFNILMAKLLKNELKQCEKYQLISFAEGLLIQKDEYVDSCKNGVSNSDALNNIRIAKKNLTIADLFFATLEENVAYTWLSKHGLYYQVLKQGKGPALQGEQRILVSFEINDPSGFCLNSDTQYLELKETLVSFMHGVQGMKIGEKRKIYIHPSLAYGVHTYLEKGIYLEILITLHEISGAKEPLPSLVPMNLSFIKDDKFLDQCEKEYSQVLRFIGKKKGEFLQKCPNIDITSVSRNFQILDDQSLISQEELITLNQYFWNLYFSNNSAIVE